MKKLHITFNIPKKNTIKSHNMEKYRHNILNDEGCWCKNINIPSKYLNIFYKKMTGKINMKYKYLINYYVINFITFLIMFFSVSAKKIIFRNLSSINQITLKIN